MLDRTTRRWVWAPNGTEIVFVKRFDYPYTEAKPSILAIDANSKVVRTVSPPPDDRIIRGFRVVPPYVYFDAFSADRIGLYRARIAGSSEPELLVERDMGLDWGLEWSVSGDQRAFAFLQSASVEGGSQPAAVLIDLETGAQRTVPVSLWGGITLSPDASRFVIVGGSIGGGRHVALVNVLDGSTTSAVVAEATIPGLDLELTADDVHWDGGAATLRYFREGRLLRQTIGEGEQVVATIAGGERGSWSTGFELVAAWLRRCTKYEPGFFSPEAICVRSEHDLMLGGPGVEAKRIAQIVRQSAPHASYTSPAAFAAGGRRLAYWFGAGGGAEDGVYVLAIE